MNQNKDMTLAITNGNQCSPNQSSNTHSRQTQDSNLHALLNLSTSLQVQGGTNQNDKDVISSINKCHLDEQDKSFLKSAINSLTVDITDHIKNIIVTISQTTDDSGAEECEDALEEALEHVGSIDIAKLFYQLGGLTTVLPLLKHDKPTLRALAARTLSECCQNNPFCQALTLQNNVLPLLLDIGKHDVDYTARFYAFSAVSAIVRDNPEGLNQFKHYNGFPVLKEALESLNKRVIAKISFFISYLCRVDNLTKGSIVEAGIIPALIEALLATNDTNSLEALLALVTDDHVALELTSHHRSKLREYVTPIINNDSDNQLVESCSRILQILDAGNGVKES